MNGNIPLAVAYYLKGPNFHWAAEKLMHGIELDSRGCPINSTAIPTYFLASHAAGLFLKAALLKRGFAEADLRKFDYRHNLDALLQEIREMGLPVGDVTGALIHGLSEQHRTHQLRYTVFVDDGAKTYWPPPALVFGALAELLDLCRISTHGR